MSTSPRNTWVGGPRTPYPYDPVRDRASTPPSSSSSSTDSEECSTTYSPTAPPGSPDWDAIRVYVDEAESDPEDLALSPAEVEVLLAANDPLLHLELFGELEGDFEPSRGTTLQDLGTWDEQERQTPEERNEQVKDHHVAANVVDEPYSDSLEPSPVVVQSIEPSDPLQTLATVASAELLAIPNHGLREPTFTLKRPRSSSLAAHDGGM